MKSLRCILNFNDEAMHPVHRYATDDAAILREYFLHAHRADEGPDTLLFYFEGDRTAYASALDAIDQVKEYEINSVRTDAHYAFIREETREFDTELEAAFDKPGVLIMPPIEFRGDGTALLTVVGKSEAVQSAIEEVPAAVDVEVTQIGDFDTMSTVPATDLTSRQREAIETAFEIGYYDVPRTGSIAKVAEEINCTPGTASELLRKAERTAIKTLIESPVD